MGLAADEVPARGFGEGGEDKDDEGKGRERGGDVERTPGGREGCGHGGKDDDACGEEVEDGHACCGSTGWADGLGGKDEGGGAHGAGEEAGEGAEDEVGGVGWGERSETAEEYVDDAAGGEGAFAAEEGVGEVTKYATTCVISTVISLAHRGTIHFALEKIYCLTTKILRGKKKKKTFHKIPRNKPTIMKKRAHQPCSLQKKLTEPTQPCTSPHKRVPTRPQLRPRTPPPTPTNRVEAHTPRPIQSCPVRRRTATQAPCRRRG